MRVRVPLLPRQVRWALVVLVAGGIFYQSVIAVPPEIPPPPDLFEFAPLDKWLHFLAYAGFGGVLAYALADHDRPRVRRALAVFAVTVAFGIGIELVQGFLPYRYMGAGDALANAIGAALALTWYLVEPRVAFVRVSELFGDAV